LENRYLTMKKSVWLFLLLCLGCTHQPKQPAVHITLINNNRSIKFTGFDYAIISEISRDTVQGIWQNLVPVYRMPADTEMKDYQSPVPGLYRLIDSALVFTPDTPFIKDQSYFVRYFEFAERGSTWDFIKGKKKLGKTPFIDLIFKQ
jgi:hypothetical protein